MTEGRKGKAEETLLFLCCQEYHVDNPFFEV